jgi:multicomponent Na+:H+ antiporter subunit C
MNVILAFVIAVQFGTGAYLLMKHDLLRDVIGLSLMTNSVILFLITTSLFRGDAPIYPFSFTRVVSDPLTQALALTAVVIDFGVTIFMLSMIYRIYTTHDSIDQEVLHKAEENEIEELERLRGE